MPIKSFDYANPQESAGVSGGRIKPYAYDKSAVVASPPKPTLGSKVGGLVTKASEFIAGAAEAPEYTGNSWGETFKNLPNEIVRTILPGAAALNDNPELAVQVTNRDIAEAVPKALFEGFVAPVASFALTMYGASNSMLSRVGLDAVGGSEGEVSFNIPGLGEVTNMQARIAKQYAEQSVPSTALGTTGAVAGYTGIELLNGLFAASLLSSVVNPRVVNVGRINSEQYGKLSVPGTLGNVPAAAKPRTFGLYQKPTIQTPTFTKLNPEFVQKLSDTGVDMSKYNPANPTFFRFEMNPKGQITGKVLSVKPSFFDEFTNILKGDITRVPETQLAVIVSKEMPASAVLKPEGMAVATNVAKQATPWITAKGTPLAQAPAPVNIKPFVEETVPAQAPSVEQTPSFRGSYGGREPSTYWLTSGEDNALRFGRDAKAMSTTNELYDGSGVHKDMTDEGIVIDSFEIKPDAKVLDTRTATIPEELDVFKGGGKVYPGADREKINEWAKQQGYDAVVFEHSGGFTHTAVFSKDSLLAKKDSPDTVPATLREYLAEGDARVAKIEASAKKGDAVVIDGKKYTIESVLDELSKDGQKKYELVDESGKSLWVNAAMLQNAEEAIKLGITTNDVTKLHNEQVKKFRDAGDTDTGRDGNKRTTKTPTQKERVAEAVAEGPLSIQEVAKLTKILEPNVRRILGVGTKEGTFARVAEGVYVLKTAKGNFAYVEMGDAEAVLARMAQEDQKFDSVILDPAYFSRALIGGNRGIKKWNFIEAPQFANVMKSVAAVVKHDDSHVYLMLSGARTAQTDMAKYAKGATDAGFKPVGEGSFTKLNKDLSPSTNVRGVEAAAERLILLTKSGKARAGEVPVELDFRFVRVLGKYQTEKPAELMQALIQQSTLDGETVLDPFAGSGVTGAEALKTGRNAVLVEKQPETVKNFTKPRVEAAAQAVKATTPAKKGALSVRPAAPLEKGKKLTINGKEYDVRKPLMTKSELKEMVKTMPGGVAEFTVAEVNGQLRMQLVVPSGKMSLRPSALGLVEDNLIVGQKITISADDLKAPGTALRAIDDEGNVSAMPRNSAGASMSKGSSPIDSFETRIGEPVDKVPEEDFKLYKKVEELIKKYAVRVGEGYLPRGAAGVFYHNTETIRLTGMNNLSVAAHEITHRLDLLNDISPSLMKVTGQAKNGNPIYDPATRAIRKELSEVYVNHYPGGKPEHKLKTRMVEGYATLLQKYVEAPITTKQNYPNLVAQMLTPGGRFYKPVIGEIITDLQAIVEDYQALSPLDKVGARVTSDLNPTGKDSFLSPEEAVVTFVADEVFPFEKVAKETGVSMTVKDPSLYIRRYKGLGSVFARNTTPGSGYWGFNGDAFVKTYDFNWGDLQKGLQKKQLYDQFGNYLVARDQHFNFVELARLKEQVLEMKNSIDRMGGAAVARTLKNEDGVSLLDEYKALRESYIDLRDQLATNGFSEQVVKESYLQNKDRFVEESAQHDVLVHEDLKLWHKVGRISDDQFEKLSAKEGYASLKRQFYDQIAGDERVMGSGSPAKRASSLKRRTGSTRTIVHPVLNGIKNHAEITRKAMKQHIENLMAEAASTNNLPDVFQKTEVVRVKDANTGAITYPQEKDPQILMGFIGGNHRARVAFEMDSTLKNSLNEILTYENAGFFMKLLVASNRLFVKGTTGAFPGFALTNASMDAVTLASQTQHNVIPIYTPLNTLYKALKNREGVVYRRFEEYLANGGELHTLVGWQDLSAKELVERVSGERHAILAVVDAINSGVDIVTLPEFRGKKIKVRTPSLDTLSLPGKWSEIASRFAEYNAAREAGDPIAVASEKAANVTVSFHKMGKFGGGMSRSVMQNTIKAIPFFNPGLQALYTMYRAGLKRGAASRNRLLAVILALVAAQVAAFGLIHMRGTQKQKDLYTGLSPAELGGYIWYPNTNGETLAKVRLPNNLNVIGTLINMNLADRYWGADYQANEYVTASTAWLPSQMNPLRPANMVFSWIPQGAKIPIQYSANVKDFPDIRAIESESQLRKEPGQRSTPQTPVVLKYIGEKFNISPIKLEFLITGYLGRASGFVTGKPGVYNPLSVLEKEYYFESSRKVQRYYDLKKENDQRHNTLKNNPSSLSIQETNAILIERAKLKQVDTLLDALGKLDVEKNKSQADVLRGNILKTIETL